MDRSMTLTLRGDKIISREKLNVTAGQAVGKKIQKRGYYKAIQKVTKEREITGFEYCYHFQLTPRMM